MELLGYARTGTMDWDVSPQTDALVSAGVDASGVFCDVDAMMTTDRPGMRSLLEHAEAGDTIVVWRLDRLGRSLREVLETVGMLVERGILLRSLQDGVDPSTTQGRLMLGLLSSLAEYERHLTSERIAAGMASARQSGTRLGRPPLDPSEIRDKIRAVEDARARGVTAADAAQLVGWSRATYYRHQQEHGSRR
jgi:DNA invertase Pin-like site-specific DNA recombinase